MQCLLESCVVPACFRVFFHRHDTHKRAFVTALLAALFLLGLCCLCIPLCMWCWSAFAAGAVVEEEYDVESLDDGGEIGNSCAAISRPLWQSTDTRHPLPVALPDCSPTMSRPPLHTRTFGCAATPPSIMPGNVGYYLSGTGGMIMENKAYGSAGGTIVENSAYGAATATGGEGVVSERMWVAAPAPVDLASSYAASEYGQYVDGESWDFDFVSRSGDSQHDARSRDFGLHSRTHV